MFTKKKSLFERGKKHNTDKIRINMRIFNFQRIWTEDTEIIKAFEVEWD